jgi:hypothetical protein
MYDYFYPNDKDDKPVPNKKCKLCDCGCGGRLVASGRPSVEEFCKDLHETLIEDMFFLRNLGMSNSEILRLTPSKRAELINA